MEDLEFPKQSVVVQANPAGATQPVFTPDNFMLFDPDQPHKSAETLARELGGVTSPTEVEHNCPGCNKSFEWKVFMAHALPCYEKWRKVAPGWRRNVKFSGATLTPLPERKLVVP